MEVRREGGRDGGKERERERILESTLWHYEGGMINLIR